ncbi:bifunctional diaminohydroxyphosphoribosylaminopyrimidine deaminase/5-amino-6-(5-phosphoribosylamino)uracil reductase RibD [Sinorhizobium medicae]|uniref:bifunctional diaminohydroxyphosphoribosylaminopyrimidine deaminase/5-amino-6-(5-phosphoribosylamino)uracil reductase RibD n=1 Tax=Sinorhizobium medicae TaxID=110321 RepID=UPI000FDB28ED|nr:bifunctional diaminohydroxyphosphoribosylaminopyrimidine deaminase/5-amino-6-(5-phosphoribosylamino)uracil reductase RibD [Sinorhizobium medicae]MDX0461118.1 bifunctional diaminohydroxyphosphoribosylaminopyrimidine deaminase/5-amino-6-(5-phosphoribosylamino)uracil reductase RibD [Sinorhizobium medicae]MDX0537333.1 bifunctional diaminohydroxyphosphoribosylaminopyrimidine deaminase/5-amino-6-(5-phosphoribosylamino)uracil reductase RibD [Sinorhizobium medicae]MDX0604807.1 bifunctional diaminohyd
MVKPAHEDERFMAAALRLSRRNLGRTGTNPSVGCVIVNEGMIVGRAVTASGGRPHAETQALAEAGEKARGATAYVTLEPCSHHGKTPPCTDALIASGVARVVVAILDPDERVAGRGIVLLREAGIAVDIGVLREEGERALQAYLMRQCKKRPHVTLKLAVSNDGMIGRRGEGQVRITGAVSRAQVQILRAETDAILVGIGTASADDPELTVRMQGLEDRSPVRIVLDRRLELPIESKLVRSAGEVSLIVVAGDAGSPSPRMRVEGERRADEGQVSGESLPLTPTLSPVAGRGGDYEARRDVLVSAGVEILNADNIPDLLAALASRGISSLLVEGGSSAARAFLDAELVDRILLFTGPSPIGKGGIPSPFQRRSVPAGFTLQRTARYGDDIFEEYERDI